MASVPKETLYLVDNTKFWPIACTMAAVRKMVVTEVPTVVQAQSGAGVFTPQGIVYQRWDPNLNGGLGGYGASIAALPGEDIPVGDGMTVIGWSAQNVSGDGYRQPGGGVVARAADVPIQIQSATGTSTTVRVREYTRGFDIK